MSGTGDVQGIQERTKHVAQILGRAMRSVGHSVHLGHRSSLASLRECATEALVGLDEGAETGWGDGASSRSGPSASLPGSVGPTPAEDADAYGFCLTLRAGSRAARQRCAAADAQRAELWAGLRRRSVSLGPPGPLGTRETVGNAPAPPGAAAPSRSPVRMDHATLKRLCRQGVPPDLRRRVWLHATGAAALAGAHHASYFAAMKELGALQSPALAQIELDLPRTFPAHAWVQSAQGQQALRDVLLALAQHSPHVGYCQGLNYVAALLLLSADCDAEDAFWLLASLVGDQGPEQAAGRGGEEAGGAGGGPREPDRPATLEAATRSLPLPSSSLGRGAPSPSSEASQSSRSQQSLSSVGAEGGTAIVSSPSSAGGLMPSPFPSGTHLPSPVASGTHLPSPAASGTRLPPAGSLQPSTSLPAPSSGTGSGESSPRCRPLLYADMYSADLSGTHVEMRTLRELVEWKLPQLASHLAALGCDISMLATDWFLCLFCTTLPAETSTRVWDALFCEGPKVLFRVALALLSAHERALLACREVGELLRTLRRAAASTHDRDALMDVAFSGVGGLPMGAIARRRARNQRGVDGERAARETRASLRAAVSKGFVLSPEAEALAREVPEPPASLHAADIAVEVPRRAVQWMAAVGGRTRDKIQGGARALHQRSKSWTVGL